MATEQIPVDPRDRLWVMTFEVFYDSYYEQLMAEAVIYRWYWLDLLARLLVALTASGSAVAAWAVWNRPDGQLVWAVLAGVSAALSITHAVLDVTGRLKELADSRSSFRLIREDADSLRNRMALNPSFDVKVMVNAVNKVRSQYAEAESKLSVDVFRTRKLMVRVQKELDDRVKDRIQPLK